MKDKWKEWEIKRHAEEREVWQELRDKENRLRVWGGKQKGLKILDETLAHNNSQTEQLQIFPRYIAMKLQNTKNKEKGNMRKKKTYHDRGAIILTRDLTNNHNGGQKTMENLRKVKGRWL